MIIWINSGEYIRVLGMIYVIERNLLKIKGRNTLVEFGGGVFLIYVWF